MKTVMKKMFSLLLVAVMLIGIMPFAAFADDAAPVSVTVKVFIDGNNKDNYNKTITLNAGETYALSSDNAMKLLSNKTCRSFEKWTDGNGGVVSSDAVITYSGVAADPSYSLQVYFNTNHTAVSDAAVPATCTTTGLTEGSHCGTCSTVLVAQQETPVNAQNHTLPDGKCACGYCDICKANPCACDAAPATKTVKAVLKQNRSADITKTEDRASDWSASVEAILTNWFKADTALFYSASVNGSEVGLTDLVKAGDELSIQLACSKCRQHPCICCSECDGTTTNHSRNCPTLQNNSGKVKVYLNLNYGNAYAYGEEMEYVWADKNELLRDVVADLAEPRRDGHYFQYWTTRDGTVIDRYNKEDRATADGVMIYAQWVDNIQSDSGTVDVTVNLMYSGLKEYINNIVPGVEMGNVLEYAGTPVRLNYKFLGWYWDKNCTNKVDVEEKIYNDRTIYAKWEYRDTNNDILLKVYLNGNTHTPVRTIDMYKYTRDDGYISMSEVKEAVKLNYTGKNTDGMYFDGLYDSTEWLKYVDNKKTADAEGSIEMEYEPGVDTIVYVMVQNAKARSYTASTSSSTTAKADSSNPKTGDAIYAPIMIMGASVSALAVLYYLNKKRAY